MRGTQDTTFIIDFDILKHGDIIQDRLKRRIASVRLVDNTYLIQIEKADGVVNFSGNGKGKNFTIRSKMPCSFMEKQLHFSDLTLIGGPYHFSEMTELRVDALKVDGPFVLKKTKLEAHDFILLDNATSIEDSFIYANNIELKQAHTMRRVQMHCDGEGSICSIIFAKKDSVEDVFIETDKLFIDSSISDTIILKNIRASFTNFNIINGHYRLLDSQLRDKRQTTEQINRFKQGCSTYRFHDWHRHQSLSMVESEVKQSSRVSSGVRLTLMRSSILLSTGLIKEESAHIRAEDSSVIAVQSLQSVDKSADGKNPTLCFINSLLVAQNYYQISGYIALKRSICSVANDLRADRRALVSIVHETSVIVGNDIYLHDVDWYSNNSMISTRDFTAVGDAACVAIEDTTVRPLNERRVALKVDHLLINCRMGLQNVIARIGTWRHHNVGELEYNNAVVIIDKKLITIRGSRMYGKGLTLQANALYLNGRLEGTESTLFIVRGECIVNKKGDISLRGRTIGCFKKLVHLGKLHVEQGLETTHTPTFVAKNAVFHKGSKVTGERFAMDTHDVTLSGKIDVTDTYQLATRLGMIRGSIQSQESIDLAADYLLANIGGRLKARDVRIVGNYLGLLGEVRARRSYSRAGGLILDADLVLSNNIMTASLISASFGVKLPNPNSTAKDLISSGNFISGGLTLLNLVVPHMAPIANAAYFISKIVRMSPTLLQFANTGSLKQLQRMRPHQWMSFLSYLSAVGFSSYQQLARFHLGSGLTPFPGFESVMTRLLSAFVSGEMNNSLIIVNGGVNLLPSSLNNALVVANVGVNMHVNDLVNAVFVSHAGIDVADSRVETVKFEKVQGAMVSRIHSLFTHRLRISPEGRDIITGRAQWKAQEVDNKGILSIQSSKHDSVLQVDQFDNKNKTALTGVTVTGFRFTNYDNADMRLHDAAFSNKIYIDNGHTSYTGFYAIQTSHYTQTGNKEALDKKSETIFSLKSDDAEFQGVVRDNKAHIEVKNLDNVKDFLQGKGKYANYHVITALELVTQQALELHGLDRDCDISITAPGIHFDDDVTFDHNVFIHSTNAMNVDHNMHGSKYLYIEADGDVVLRSSKDADLSARPPSLDIDAKDGVYIKSDHGKVIGEGVHAKGKAIIIEADGDIILDARVSSQADGAGVAEALAQALQNSPPSEWDNIIAEFENGQMFSTPSDLDGQQIAEKSDHGNIVIDGAEKASDTIQIAAPEGHITIGGVLVGGNSISILADTGLDLLSEKSVKYEQFGPRTFWNPSQITAGAGGINILVKRGDAVIDSSNMHAKGTIAIEADNINLRAHTNTYTSDREHHRGFLGFNSHDRVTETTAVFRSNLTSDSQVILQARQTIRSDGAVIQGKQGTYLIGKHGVRLYDIVGHTRTVDKSSSFWGLTYDKTTYDQEFNVSTCIFDSTEVGIQSQSGDVLSIGSYIIAPKATLSGKNVLLYGRTLNNQWSHETRGLHVSAFGVPIFSSHSTYMPFQYSNSTANDVQAVSSSDGVAETGLKIVNLGTDAYNTAQSIESGLSNGQLTNNILRQEGFIPGLDVGLQTTHQSGTYQSVGGGGIYVDNLTINAENRVVFDNLPVAVTHDAHIHARQFDQFGTSLNNEYSSSTKDVTLGFTAQGVDHATFSASQSMSQSQRFVNQQFLVGGHLDVDVNNWTLNGANTDVGSLTAHVSEQLTEKTHISTSDTHSKSGQVSTSGNVGGSVSKQHDEHIDTVSSIHAHGNSTIDAHTINLEGSKITADGKVNVTADTINGESVHTHSSSDSYSASGNARNFEHNTTGANAPKHINTSSVTDSGSRHDETQQSVIHGEGGTNIQANHIHGSIDTKDSDGSTVDRNRRWNYRANIPTGFESSDVAPIHNSNPSSPQHNITQVSPHHSMMGASSYNDTMVTETADTTIDDNSDIDTSQTTIKSTDSIEDASAIFRENKTTITYQTFKDRMPVLMDDDEDQDDGTSEFDMTDDEPIDPAYVNSLVDDPVQSLLVYDIDRQAANILYGRPVLYDYGLESTTSFLDNSDISFGRKLLNEYQGIFSGMSGPSDLIMAGMNYPVGVTKDLISGVGEFFYDQFNEAEYVLSGGYFGDPDSIARNELRGKAIINYFSALANSQFGTEEQGYLIGEGSILLLPAADFSGAMDITLDMSRASLLAGRGLFAPGVVETQLLDPFEIRYSQQSVSYVKYRPNKKPYTIDSITDSMKKDGWLESEGPIDVVELPEGGYTSLDNTRIMTAQDAGIQMEARVHKYNERLPSTMNKRFKHPKIPGDFAQTWGEALEYRLFRQNLDFQHQCFPVGTYNRPVVTYPKNYPGFRR